MGKHLFMLFFSIYVTFIQVITMGVAIINTLWFSYDKLPTILEYTDRLIANGSPLATWLPVFYACGSCALTIVMGGVAYYYTRMSEGRISMLYDNLFRHKSKEVPVGEN